MSILSIQTPRVFAPLLAPSRYKGAHGGRGSGKSHFFAELLIERALLQQGLRWLCVREIQKSLEQSVKRLIEDKIAALEVGSLFRIMDKEIQTPGGGHIIFQGMQNHTADSVKSFEGYDGAWVEEAQALSMLSLELLRPTIRKPNSEIWFSWNPRKETDAVDAMLRGPKKVTNAIVVEANWRDNPWFSSVLEQERADDAALRPERYDHVWEGGYEIVGDAVIFKNKVKVEAFETLSDARFFHGADWGFADDPTDLTRSYVHDRCLFVDHEVTAHGVELDELPALFDTVPTARRWPIKADSARPETISFMRRKGFNISAAAKWPGSVEDGIEYLKSFRQIVIHPRCKNLVREARLYSYKVDQKQIDPETNMPVVLPIVVDKHNHGWDSLRYGLDGYIKKSGTMTVQPLRI